MMDHESDEEMSSQKDEVGSISNGGSPNRAESPTSSAGDAPYSPNQNDPESPMDNGPQSPDQEPRSPHSPQSPENEPQSPENEPQSPENEPQSPDNSGSEIGIRSPEPPTHSPVGSEVDRESNKDEEDVSKKLRSEDENENSDEEKEVLKETHNEVENDNSEDDKETAKETQIQDENENSEDEEVVREDAESGDEGRESEGEGGPSSPNGNVEMAEAEDNADKTLVASDVEEGNKREQAEDDDDDASVEERASIHSDDEEENIENNESVENNENQNDAGEGTSGIDDTAPKTEKQKEESTTSMEKKDDEQDSDANSEVEELIADIFGESDEEEEFEGFGEEDLAKAKEKNQQRKKTKALSDSEEDEEEKTAQGDEEKVRGDEDKPEENQENQEATEKKDSSDDDDDDVKNNHRSIEIYDFDLMMERKKAEAGPRRRKRDHDSIITDSDDLIVDIIDQMKHAAEEDRTLNRNKLAATKKLKLLPVVGSQLKKADLKISFLEQGVLNVMSEWLSPLPDRSLPHLHIRQLLLKLLGEFPSIDQDTLKHSGIGRAVMYLYKHPKEIKENKVKAGRLISEWSRPIFNLRTDFQSISKEEREKRDFEHMPKKLKMRLEGGEESAQDINTALAGDEKSLRPGEKGWVGRARVPMPSTRDYVVRPKWNVETEFSKASKKQLTRLDKHIRNLKEKKKQSKIQRAITISIEGRKMSL